MKPIFLPFAGLIHSKIHVLITASVLSLAGLQAQVSAPAKPTLANVPYGRHERQVLDFYQAKSAQAAPLLFFIHGGGWMTVYADDGISDSPKERYTIDVSVKTAGEYAVTIRVYDVNGNSGNARVVVRR